VALRSFLAAQGARPAGPGGARRGPARPGGWVALRFAGRRRAVMIVRSVKAPTPRSAGHGFVRLALLCTLALAGLAGPFWAAARPRPLEIFDRAEGVRWPRVWFVPDAVPPSREARLERRLAALARRMELRPRLDEAPVRFDVEGLSSDIERILSRVKGRAQVSVHVRDLESGHVLFDHYGDTALTPASTQKLLTGAAALDLLGPDYRFVTRVLARPGALVLQGEGDPVLRSADLAALAREVAGIVPPAGIRTVVVDDSAFPARAFPPGLYDPTGPGYAYQAPTSALSVDFNTVEVTVTAGRSAGRPRVWTDPACEAVVVDNRARVGRRDTLRVRARPRGTKTVIEVRGTIPRGSAPRRVRRRIYAPAFLAGCLFAEALVGEGARAPEVVRGRAAPGDDPVAIHFSPPLVEIVEAGLAYSNNFVAEQILRTIAREWAGGADFVEGAAILEAYSDRLGLGLPGAVAVENGSGLSRAARLSSRALVDLLEAAYRGRGDGVTLLDVLPVAGEPGTLRTRLRISGKRVRAKTGTLDGVSGLSGVVTREDGTPQLGFAILTNAAPGAHLPARERRRLEDRIVLALLRALDHYESQRTGLSPTPARRPRARAR